MQLRTLLERVLNERLHVRKAASGQEADQYCRRPALGFVPQTYADHLKRMVEALTEEFTADGTINLVMTHLTVVGAKAGGG